MSNILNIGKKYLRHFVNNNGVRWVLLQGGRRSGKSFAIHKWLHFLASGKPITVGVVTATFPALQLAISDFQRATNLTVSGNVLFGYSCQLPNGSVFLFRSFETPQKAQGSTFTILYLEECLNIDEDVVSVLAMSVEKQIYAAFNPTRKSYISKYEKSDKSNLLITTFKDNPYLTDEQREEFEAIKERALRPNASVLDQFNYSTYYLGEYGSMSGKVFPVVYTCSDDDFDSVPSPILTGIDFGFVLNGDPTAICDIKIHKGRLYCKERLYSNTLVNNKDLALEMSRLGYDVYSNIVGDYGGIGASRIRALVSADNGSWDDPKISAGFTITNAVKGKIIDGLNRMAQYEIWVTESSQNLRDELDNLELTPSQTVKNGCADHLCDCVRYATRSYYLFFEDSEKGADVGD